jgi:hypothetical protein
VVAEALAAHEDVVLPDDAGLARADAAAHGTSGGVSHTPGVRGGGGRGCPGARLGAACRIRADKPGGGPRSLRPQARSGLGDGLPLAGALAVLGRVREVEGRHGG